MARSHEITLYGAIHGVSIKVRVDMRHLFLCLLYMFILLAETHDAQAPRAGTDGGIRTRLGLGLPPCVAHAPFRLGRIELKRAPGPAGFVHYGLLVSIVICWCQGRVTPFQLARLRSRTMHRHRALVLTEGFEPTLSAF